MQLLANAAASDGTALNDDRTNFGIREDAATASAVDAASAPDINIVEDGLGERLQDRLSYIARRKYRLRDDVADDLVQTALITYLEVRHRYPTREEHAPILVGIMRNKCREYIRKEVRSDERMRAMTDEQFKVDDTLGMPRAACASSGVLSELMERESGQQILEALSSLRPRARRMFELMRQGATRQDLIRILGINKNTVDSRLHAYRSEFRELLAHRGIRI